MLFCPFLNESLERIATRRGLQDHLKVQFAQSTLKTPSSWVRVDSEGVPLILPSGNWKFHGDSAYLKSDKDDRLLVLPIKEVAEFLSFVRNFPGVRDIRDEFELMDNMYSRDLSERCRLLDTGSEIFIRFALIEPKTVIGSQGLQWIRKGPGLMWWYQKTYGPQNFGWIHIMINSAQLHLIVMTRRPEVIADAQNLALAQNVGFRNLGFTEKSLQERLRKVFAQDSKTPDSP